MNRDVDSLKRMILEGAPMVAELASKMTQAFMLGNEGAKRQEMTRNELQDTLSYLIGFEVMIGRKI
jgi:hypothetical protein